ncbi:putative hydro-lyase [Youngiibacter multivorans]|uniref:Uncharacterized protein YcsI (UPF0317 family) n=1 Tax=Youngiibacter multivorans TaxID=937251 RepID=A0ABS4G7C3_9CLOT|nr:putative hydro-lyase [Youngiibacter multivorans]MBP1920429.1 uncharacterized protein YcsI (UPF0317 family) [Youngiibacter multivorans]
MLSEELKNLSGEEVRQLIREGKWRDATAGVASGFVQANILILPRKYVSDFMLFCIRNPKPCALIEVLDPGVTSPVNSCRNSDIRFDIPKYRVFENGRMVAEETDIANYWREDYVSFLMGCSYTFENALINSGISIRHIEEGKKVPLYSTNIACNSVSGIDVNMVVSMRPIPYKDLTKTIQITSKYPSMHGAPIHIGNPAEIGIEDINTPFLGDPVTIRENEVPVFWACGGTVYNYVEKLKCSLAITHAPSHMYILDVKDDDFREY